MKKILFIILVLLIIVAGLTSCSRGITPYQAANGGARCGNHLR